MMMTNPAHEAVFDYWANNTRGYLDFRDSALFPWVDIALDASEVGSREVHGQKAYDAAKALPGAILDGFDVFLVLVHPGTAVVPNPDAGKPGQPATVVTGLDGGAGYNLDNTPACSLPVMTGDHTFFCHEFGHVLGFSHSYGVVNNGIEWDGKPPWDEGTVYGDPYDLMSSASFGTRNRDANKTVWISTPTFKGMLPAGWPNPNAASMGPGLARAHIHQWDPQALPPGTVRDMPYPVGGAMYRVRLVGAGRSSQAPSLLVLRPPGEDAEGRFRCYVEYRSKNGWDMGLHEATDNLARRAVVVHTLNDATGDGVRCWYRGHIVVPTETDTDLAPAFTLLVVRVIDVDEDAGAVEVEIGTSSPREIEIKARHFQSLLLTSDEEPMQTPCGDTIVSATRIYQSTSLYRASTRGYGDAGDPGVVSPVITWTVADQPIAPGTGTVDVDTPDGTFTLQYELFADPNELALVARGGERYTATVMAKATESNGNSSRTTTDTFNPIGWTTGFTVHDLTLLDTCLARKLRRVFVRPLDWLLPQVEDDGLNRMYDRINQSRLREILRRVVDQYPTQALELEQLIEMRARQLR
jgi:hypothetical protein